MSDLEALDADLAAEDTEPNAPADERSVAGR
jgi:hypothetical protein